MNKKIELLAELSARTFDKITQTKDAWRDFLKFSARFYKYNFSDTVLIYAQNPRATTCASYEEWNKYGRYINSGENGLPLIDESLSRPVLKYVFDVSQTNSQVKEAPQSWTLKKEHLPAAIAEIKSRFGTSIDRGDYKDIKAAVEEYARTAAEQHLEGIRYEIKGSRLEGLDFENVKQFFVETVIDSVGYTVADRCGLPQGLYNDDQLAFMRLREFDTKPLMTRIGTAVSAISEGVLRTIERKVRALDRETLLRQRSVQYERKDSQRDDNSRIVEGIGDANRGNHAPGADGANAAENRQIRAEGDGLHETDRPVPPESADDGGQAPGGVRTSGRGRERPVGNSDGTASPTDPAATDRQLSGAGAVQQSDSRYGGGNHTGGDHLQGAVSDIDHAEGTEQSVPSFAPTSTLPEQLSFATIPQTEKQPTEEKTESSAENLGLGFLDWDTSGTEIQEETAPPDKTELPALPQERHDFTITDADEIGMGGLKTKYKQNVSAIRLLKQIEDESRLATPDEQKILAKYVGWGGMPQAFDPEKSDWRGEYQELQGLLTEEEYRSARSTTLNAHYTSTQVIDAIYQGIRWLGFEKGNILEPAMGVGNFFGRLPTELRDSKLYGVELDDITGRLAGQLYQNADIRVTGFERTAYPDNFFDVAIGNVPFGSYSVADLKYDKYKFLIHDYFFAKALEQVRPGGLVAFVTSKGTMDKENTFVRQYLAERVELLGAIRLPNTAFKANANTEVTTDILFLQKKSEAVLKEGENKWFGLNRLPDSDIFVNEYFANHPEMMMGTMALDKSMYGNENETALHDDGRDLQVALHEAVRTLPYNVMTEREDADSLDMDDGLLADLNTRNYCYAVINGEIYQRENSRMIKQEFSGVQAERVTGLIELRDQVRYLINIQTQDCPDDVLLNEQGKLNTIYDRFVHKFGAVSDRGNRLAFRDDADYPMLCALEIPEDETVRKADMFFKRTIRAKTEITSCDTSQEALTIALNEKGRLDLAYMSRLTGKPAEEITEDLKGVIFKNPLADEMDNELSGWETADEYLSGNVRRKLEIAKQTAEIDPRYEINVSRLEQAQPEWLDASKIDVRLGATWVGTDTVRQFLLSTLHPSERTVSDLQVDYSPVNATWTISGRPRVTESDVEAFSTYGTARSNAYEITDDLLNQRSVSIYDTVRIDGSERRVLNKTETIAARDKADQLQTAFKRWIFDDPDRRERLVRRYNELFNSDKLRVYDGAHLTFPGMSPLKHLREHQYNAVARILYGGNTLLAHEVGAGKTYVMIAAAMELRRLGIAKKPLFVCRTI